MVSKFCTCWTSTVDKVDCKSGRMASVKLKEANSPIPELSRSESTLFIFFIYFFKPTCMAIPAFESRRGSFNPSGPLSFKLNLFILLHSLFPLFTIFLSLDADLPELTFVVFALESIVFCCELLHSAAILFPEKLLLVVPKFFAFLFLTHSSGTSRTLVLVSPLFSIDSSGSFFPEEPEHAFPKLPSLSGAIFFAFSSCSFNLGLAFAGPTVLDLDFPYSFEDFSDGLFKDLLERCWSSFERFRSPEGCWTVSTE